MSKEATVSRTAYTDRKQIVTKRIDVVEARLNEIIASLRALRAETMA